MKVENKGCVGGGSLCPQPVLFALPPQQQGMPHHLANAAISYVAQSLSTAAPSSVRWGHRPAARATTSPR